MPGIDEVLAEAMGIPGVLGASLVDASSGLALGTAGQGPQGDHEAAAADTTEVVLAVTRNHSFTGGAAADGSSLEDVIVTVGGGFHLMRMVRTEFDSQVYLYVWLDREQGNLAVARHRLRGLSELLVLA
ncbi:hypothetical protein AB0C51_16140 [Streptomyces pathocidini]|uniref:hypothetical protein n=1 Tax=Streptomyces pathocidini TaxID=1650571 RepID=UPI00340DA637